MTTPGTANLVRHDLNKLHNVAQNTIMAYPKELVISLLRDEFSKDTYYHYVADPWGFPKVNDHTDLPLDAGYQDDQTTRIFIGEAWRHDAIMYPALFVKMTSAKSVPISMSRNKGVVEYEKQLFVDGYGNTKELFTPRYIDLAGAWSGTITIDVHARDSRSRDELLSILMLMFTDIQFESLRKAGILVMSGEPSISGISEGDDRQQEKLFKGTVNIGIRSEWRRLIPIDGVIEKINLCVEFGTITDPNISSPNLQISQSLTLLDQIEAL